MKTMRKSEHVGKEEVAMLPQVLQELGRHSASPPKRQAIQGLGNHFASAPEVLMTHQKQVEERGSVEKPHLVEIIQGVA